MGKKEGKELTVSKRVTITRTLPVELGPEEYRATSRSLAQNIEALARTMDEKKSAMGGYTQRIESLNATISELSGVVSSGKRWMEVECIETNNYDTGYVEMIRVDTGEVVSSRPMGLEDRQAGLFDRGEDAAPIEEAPPANEESSEPETIAAPAEEGVEPPSAEELSTWFDEGAAAEALTETSDDVPEIDVEGPETDEEDEEETGETEEGDPDWD